jgi:DNA-binding response OmpR family regulator
MPSPSDKGPSADGAAPRGKTVLVVDDEPTIVEIVGRYIERAGFETYTAADGYQALDTAGAHRPDLVVLDVMLPGIDGIEVMERLQERPGPPIAVILLTARGEESDRLVGLRHGADDYVVKPFSPAELVARVDAVLRRTGPVEAPGPPIAIGPLTVDVAAHRVTVGGEEVALTQREFDLLAFLARHPGRAFSREELMDRVWRYSFYTDTATVTVHIRRLRTKLGATPAAAELIETVWGVGYRLAAP